MKVAICMSGGLRCFKETYQFTDKFIFSKLDYDLYFYGTENKEGKEQNLNDFTNLYNPKSVIINDTEFYTDIINSFDINWDKKQNLIPMFFNIYMCNELRKNSNVHYDIVIRCRPDCFFKQSIPEQDFINAATNTLLVPGCWSFGGVSDLFAIANSNVYNSYASTYLNLKEYFDANIIHPEIITHKQCEKHNLSVQSIEKYMEFEFPDIVDSTIENITFNNAGQRNFKYSYDKK